MRPAVSHTGHWTSLSLSTPNCVLWLECDFGSLPLPWVGEWIGRFDWRVWVNELMDPTKKIPHDHLASGSFHIPIIYRNLDISRKDGRINTSIHPIWWGLQRSLLSIFWHVNEMKVTDSLLPTKEKLSHYRHYHLISRLGSQRKSHIICGKF